MALSSSRIEFNELLENEESYMSRWCNVTDFHGVRFFHNPILPTHLFNFVTRLWQFPDGAALQKQIEHTYGTPSLPHRLFFGPKEPQQLASFFTERGYALLSERLILAHDLTLVPESHSPHVHVKAIENKTELHDWVGIAIRSWTHPRFPQDFDQVVLSIVDSGLADGEFTCYLAEIDGGCAGTGLLNRQGQLAGVHAITTTPAARGRGVATAVVARMVADAAAQGCAAVCLQTGKGDGADLLYQRMGFSLRFSLGKYGVIS